MTIVTRNSLTLSNVNDGTITHTAYAYSADGTDRFTTVYPNLNLLNDGRFSEQPSPKWTTDGTTISKDETTGFFKIKFNGNTVNNRTYYGSAFYEIPTGQKYSISVKAYSLENSLDVNFGAYDGSRTITITNNGNLPKVYKIEGMVTTGSNALSILGGTSQTLGTLFISEIKLEKGEIATPYMPSSSEVKTSDYPSYRGEYSDFSSTSSTDPSKYSWGLIKGSDSYTHTAYSWSADGSDRFTTVYPNLNLLDGTKDFSGDWKFSQYWTNDGTYKGLTVKKKTNQWNGITKIFTVPKDGIYTFSAYVKSSGNTANINRFGGVNTLQTQPVLQRLMGNNFDWTRDIVTLNLKANDTVYIRYEIAGSGTDSILWTAGHKWEEGSVATPYMESVNEVKTSDYPNYIGTYLDNKIESSSDYKRYQWTIFKGQDSNAHTAYSWSSDGTDRFTTAYPNLNLLDGTRDFSGTWTNLEIWTTDGTYKGLAVKKKTTQWSGIYKTFTAPKDGDYSFSAYVKSSGNTANIVRFVRVNNISATGVSSKVLGNNFDWTKDSFSLALKAGDVIYAKYEISSNGTDSILWTAGHKWESGTIATPYMSSSSEVTTADWPSYIGQYSDFTSTVSTDPAKYAPWTIFKGNDGVGVTSTVITYAMSTSGTTAPSTGWTSSVPSLVKGQYLWTKTVWTYTDNSTETGYSVTYISKDGTDGDDGLPGKDGVGIKTTTITYASHTNGTTAPTTGYTATVPSVPAGQFLWTKTVWTYTDNTSETGYSVAKMGDTGPTGPAGAPGSNGAPGKIVSNSEPISLFTGLTWKYSGTTDLTASDGTKILAGTEYYWNGTAWTLYEVNAHNINGDNLSVTNGTFKDGKIESIWGKNGVNGTTTIESSHLQIYSSDSTTNTENTVAIDNLQGYAQVYTDRNTGRTITVQASVQGFFVSDSTGPYVRVTPNGIENSVDVSWTTIGSYAAYRRDGRVVTIRVVGAKRSTNGDIYIGTIPLKNCPAASVMGNAIAWSAGVANDKHIQINGLNQSSSGAVTILSAVANQEYTFQFTYQV